MVLRSRWGGVAALLGLVVALGGGVESVAAQPQSSAEIARRREEAQKLANEGWELLQKGRYDEAVDKFREADRNAHSPLFQVQEASAEMGRGRLVEARALLKRVVDEPLPEYAPDTFWQAKDEAKKQLGSLDARVPRIRVVLLGEQLDGAEVAVDGKAVAGGASAEPVLVNPGKHQAEARVADGRAVSRTVTAEENNTAEARLDLGSPVTGPPDVEPPAPTGGEAGGRSYVLPGILFGVGGASLLVGIITGGMFVSRAGDLKDRCPENQCQPEDEEEGDAVSTLGDVSTATLIIGAAGIVAGTIFLFVPLGDDDPAPENGEAAAFAPRLRIGAGNLGLAGRF